MSPATANQPFVFSPGATPVAATAANPLVNETRREIAEIVREIANAADSDRTVDEFLSLLVDRILRAMAAEGVMVWQRSETLTSSGQSSDPQFRCVRRLGRITDQSIPAVSAAAHRRLLSEVARDRQPVVVPATPGASDIDVPANPMDVPVALVTIELENSHRTAEYLLEVFLEPDCGVATQRGYLRFVAQMAELASKFLRADELRRLRRGELLARQVDAVITSLHEIYNREKLEAAIVDGAAELFDFDRVGLCLLGPKATLAAVSHVNSIDVKSVAARELCDAARIDVDADGCVWFEDSSRDASDCTELAIRAVVETPTIVPGRLVCLQAANAQPVSSECRRELVRYVRHAGLALGHAARLEAIPGGRLLASLAPALHSGRHRFWKPIVLSIAAITILLVAGFFPVPLVVYSTASIRPQRIQMLAAPRDGVVEQVHVQHGQEVFRGERLLTLVDPSLEAEISALVGRRAVLVQQRSRWTEALVDSSSHGLDRMEQVQSERSLVGEEIQAIEDQLAVLRQVKESLHIRADRNGIVDAWQIEQRLQSRPLRRGDPLLQVIEKDSPWIVDVRVAQSRIAHVQDADAKQNLLAHVSLEAKPDQSYPATLMQIGPAVVLDHEPLPSTAVLLRLGDEASLMMASKQATGHPSGAPARVMFRCGNTPAAYLIFQDVIRSVRGNLALYLADHGGRSGDHQ